MTRINGDGEVFMKARSMLANALSALVFSLASIAGSGCVVSPDIVSDVDDGPIGSVSQAVSTPNPTAIRISSCTPPPLVANWIADTGIISLTGQGSSPILEPGTCASDAFTVFDPFESSVDPYDLNEAAEWCGNVGGSSSFVKYFLNPSNGCADYPNNGTPLRRWVSYFGCCEAGTTVPAQTVPLTKTNRDCSGALVDTPQTQTFGSATIGPNNAGQLIATVVLQNAAPNTAYNIRLIQTPNDGTCSTADGAVTTDAVGNANTVVQVPLVSTTQGAFMAINEQSNFNSFFTSEPVFF
ncbi:Hypothetical protein A7982_02116 [Minicystis rosea]|nr:Hypothetical protein A7982_02116 [Minicystis rosea]